MPGDYQPTKATAEVESIQGILIFSDCKPIQPYDYLGTVKSTGTGGFASGEYASVRDRLIKNAKKDYPNADGLILNLRENKTDQADAIKFK